MTVQFDLKSTKVFDTRYDAFSAASGRGGMADAPGLGPGPFGGGGSTPLARTPYIDPIEILSKSA